MGEEGAGDWWGEEMVEVEGREELPLAICVLIRSITSVIDA